jgi:hypothetical protein
MSTPSDMEQVREVCEEEISSSESVLRGMALPADAAYLTYHQKAIIRRAAIARLVLAMLNHMTIAAVGDSMDHYATEWVAQGIATCAREIRGEK